MNFFNEDSKAEGQTKAFVVPGYIAVYRKTSNSSEDISASTAPGTKAGAGSSGRGRLGAAGIPINFQDGTGALLDDADTCPACPACSAGPSA